MDSSAVALLSLETMGEAALSRVVRSRRESGSCMEHGEVRSWPMALEPQSGAGYRFSGPVFLPVGSAIAV